MADFIMTVKVGYQFYRHTLTKRIMKRESVTSSVLRSIGYSATTHILEVEFVEQKDIYQYHNVPKNIYHDLMTASSLGQYFNKHIKNQYAFTKKE